jgi:hypothetical protein
MPQTSKQRIPLSTPAFLVALATGLACSFRDDTTVQIHQTPPRVDAGNDSAADGGAAMSTGGAGLTITASETDAGTSDTPAPSGENSTVETADAGVVPVEGADGSPTNEPPCTGCVRLAVYEDEIADYQLNFGPVDLANTTIVWRVRVYDYSGDVSFIGYVDSGDDFGGEATTGMTTLAAGAGWQEIRLDLSALPASPGPSLLDAGGAGDAGFNSGSSFDRAKVLRVGLAVQPGAAGAGPHRATLELDAVTFSDLPELNVDFAADQGGFVLVDSADATATQVP